VEREVLGGERGQADRHPDLRRSGQKVTLGKG
jgi:hypothetical protein